MQTTYWLDGGLNRPKICNMVSFWHRNLLLKIIIIIIIIFFFIQVYSYLKYTKRSIWNTREDGEVESRKWHLLQAMIHKWKCCGGRGGRTSRWDYTFNRKHTHGRSLGSRAAISLTTWALSASNCSSSVTVQFRILLKIAIENY